MKLSVLKRAMLLLCVVFLLFSLSACKTIQAAVSFQWGQWDGNGHPHEVVKLQKEAAAPDWVAMMDIE